MPPTTYHAVIDGHEVLALTVEPGRTHSTAWRAIVSAATQAPRA